MLSDAQNSAGQRVGFFPAAPLQIDAERLTPADFPTLIEGNGPIISNASFVSLYIGGVSSSDIDTMQAWLTAYAANLSGTDPETPPNMTPTIAQYGISGATVGPFIRWSAMGWNPWASMGGPISDAAPVVARNADGRLEVFATGTDGALWHNWQTAPDNGWSGWASLGGQLTGVAAVGRNADGRLEVFATGTDGALWHNWQTAPDNGWSGWASLGGDLISDPVVDRNADGRLEVFATGTDGALWHKWQTAPNDGWSGWSSLGGVMNGTLAVRAAGNGTLAVFTRGTGNALWWNSQTAPNDGWSGWASLGGNLTSSPVAATTWDGRLEVFATGTDGGMWHIWQQVTPTGSFWSGWFSLGGSLQPIFAAGSNQDGRLEVFATGTDGLLWHNWQMTYGDDHINASWSGWNFLGTGPASVAAGSNADGRLEVFTSDPLGVDHISQQTPNPLKLGASDGDFHDLADALQSDGTLPQLDGTRLLLIFTSGVTFANEGSTANFVSGAWCGYHGNWGLLTSPYYALCPRDWPGGGCGTTPDAWQSLTSHEIQEAMTDPVPGTGWAVPGGNEGGDVCSWKEAQLSFGTVQRFADNRLKTCTVFTTRSQVPMLHLLEFIPDNVGGRIWNAYDRTNDTGLGISGDPAAYGSGVRTFARGTSNNLLEFIPDNVGGRIWNVYDHTIDTGVPIAGDPAVYTAPGGGGLRVFVRGTSDNLLEFIPDNVGGRIWNAYDHTIDTGVPITGDPAVFAGGLRVFVRGTSDNLLEFIPDNLGGRIWNAYDHTIDTGVPITGDPAVYAGALLVYVPSTLI